MADWTTRFSLAGRTALVTGASRGIGAEICSVFADAGANIVALARDRAGLESVAKTVREHGRECQSHVCDLADAASVDAMVATVQACATVDILVNNAGVALVAPALELSLQDWDRTMAVNVRAPFQLARAFAPGMIERGAGKIINVSSQAAVIAFEEHAAYCASKAALNALTRALMSEWAQHGIQVNAICPTVILTAMGRKVWDATGKSAPMIARTPARRFGEPVDVADMALYLASSASDLVNGESLMIDGGFSAV